MKAGMLTRRLILQRRVETQDASGDPVATWTTMATVWAAIEPLRGREALISGGINAELDTRITVRWSPLLATLSDNDRAVYGSTIYNIVSIAEKNMGHRELEILANSGLNEG